MRKIITSLAALLVLAVSGCAPQVAVEAEVAAIRAANKEWQKAAKAKDLDHFFSFYAEDAEGSPREITILRAPKRQTPIPAVSARVAG